MREHWHPGRPDEADLARGMSRRALLRLLAAGAGTSALTAILAACGGGEVPATTPPNTRPAATRAGGAGATTAPTATAGTVSPAAAAGGGQVSIHWSKPVTFNPLFSTAGAEQGVERLLFGALVKVNDQLEAVPDIAERIDVSPDATTYTFILRKGLAFTDGKPLTATDIVFTFERAVDKRTGSYWRGRLLDLVGAAEYGEQKADRITGLETPDDYTVKMTLKHPDATWLLTLGDFAGLGILPAHILQDVAPDQLRQHSFSLNPSVTAGVFQFGKYETDQFLELKRNDAYGGPRAKLDRIFFRISTPDVALAQLERGELDLMIVPIAEVDRLKRAPAVTVVSVPSPSFDFLALNLERPYLQDKRVRQAMQYALDREAIVKEIYRGEAQVVNQAIIGPEWMGTPEVNPYRFDPARARQLLREANWDGNRKLEGIYTPGGKEREAYAPILQQLFKDVGINLELRVIEPAEYNRKLVQQSDYEIAFVGGGIFRQDPNVAAKYFETANWTPLGGNYEHYSNPKVDELFKAGRATADREQRKKIYTEIATILNDELPWIFLWSPNSLFAHTKRLVGFKPPSYATHQVWNAEEWSVAG